MATITAPTFAFRGYEWELDQPAQVNRSAYTGARRVVSNPWHGIWRATLSPKIEQGEANFRALRGFFASLLGQVNTFQLPATEGAQHTAANTTLSVAAAQGAISATLTTALPISKGMFATFPLPSGNKQMVILTADISGSVISFRPALREAVALGATIETKNPYALMALTDSKFRWSVQSWRRYSIDGIAVEEAF